MRKVLVSLMVLSFLPALATAAVTNPDDFEGYALTTDWIPTVIGEGWLRYGELGDPQTGSSVGIITGTLAGNTTQVLELNTNNGYEEPGSGENLTGEWNMSVPDSAVPVTQYSMEFAATGFLFGSEYRNLIARKSLAGETGVLIEIGYGNWWGGGMGIPEANLLAADYDAEGNRTWDIEAILGVNGEFDPDTGTFVPGNEVWYVVEFEDDNVLSKTRARIYDKTTTPGAEDGWTSWLTHDPDYNGLDYADGGVIVAITNGIGEWDNFSMTEAPVVAHLEGDANNDGLVSADDYASVQGHFGETGANGIDGDANNDGLVSADDYASVQGHFGDTAGVGGVSVPEPATMLLLAAGSLLLVKRKRKS